MNPHKRTMAGAALGAEVSPTGPEQLGAMVRSERERYGKLIREAKITAN